jgi:hypothetical protein
MAMEKGSVVSAAQALMKQASECGRSKQNTCSFIRTPPVTPTHSPKIYLRATQRMNEQRSGAILA